MMSNFNIVQYLIVFFLDLKKHSVT